MLSAIYTKQSLPPCFRGTSIKSGSQASLSSGLRTGAGTCTESSPSQPHSNAGFLPDKQGHSRIKVDSRVKDARMAAAGWSSLVARRAHNPKVVGSNPAPATRFMHKASTVKTAGAFCCAVHFSCRHAVHFSKLQLSCSTRGMSPICYVPSTRNAPRRRLEIYPQHRSASANTSLNA